jgi:hypothetical protein
VLHGEDEEKLSMFNIVKGSYFNWRISRRAGFPLFVEPSDISYSMSKTAAFASQIQKQHLVV